MVETVEMWECAMAVLYSVVHQDSLSVVILYSRRGRRTAGPSLIHWQSRSELVVYCLPSWYSCCHAFVFMPTSLVVIMYILCHNGGVNRVLCLSTKHIGIEVSPLKKYICKELVRSNYDWLLTEGMAWPSHDLYSCSASWGLGMKAQIASSSSSE